MPKSITPVRRFLALIFGAALFALGTWLLYRHLLFGDQFSIHLTLSAALMIGWGIMIVPTALVGGANVTGRIEPAP
jgi:hypothetical protein